MHERVLQIQARAAARKKVINDYELMTLRAIEQTKELERQRRIRELLLKAPPRFLGKTLAHFEVNHEGQALVKKVASQYVATFHDRLLEGTSLLLTGRPGTGKTLISLIIYQALAEDGFDVCYEPTTSFLRKFQESKFNSSSAYETLLEHYVKKSLVIIDEISHGTRKGGLLASWERQLLFELINARYQEKKPVVVISNTSKESLIHDLGLEIIDRILEGGITLGFDWPSYRSELKE